MSNKELFIQITKIILLIFGLLLAIVFVGRIISDLDTIKVLLGNGI